MASTFLQYFKGALKIVLVGDSKVGKTSLLSRSHELYATFSDGCSFLKKPYVHSEVYSPTVFETCITNVDTECLGNYQANIWDTGGYGVFRSVRPLAYIDADVFMMCFDITNRESFENLTEVWLPEIQSFQPNTPVLFVGMKGDLRTISSNRESHCWVTVSEAESIAHQVGCAYVETSAKTGENVTSAFANAVKIGHINNKKLGGRKRMKTEFADLYLRSLTSISSPPQLTTDPSTYVSDFTRILEDVAYADILFKFEDGSQSIPAHKIVFWFHISAFRHAFFEKNWNLCEKFQDSFMIKETDFEGKTCVVLKKWFSHDIFVKILEFLYTGEVRISKNSEHEEIDKLLNVAKKLEVVKLVDICEYLLDVKDTLNHSEMTEMSLLPKHTVVKDFFLDDNMALYSDVTFIIEGTLVFAHKAVLVARSPVFAALLSDKFADGRSPQVALPGVDYRTFLAVLEYLYTDNCTSLGNIPVEDVLVLADCLCLTRLVQICEVQMHKGLLNMTKKDLLDVLAFSKMFNAKQVTEWCLYVIGLNFLKYESVEKEFELIVSEHSQFFEKHCWPPQDHRKVLKKYRQSAKRNRWDKRQLTQRGSSCLPLNCHVM